MGSFVYSFLIHLVLVAVVSASIGAESEQSQIVQVQLLSNNEAQQSSMYAAGVKSRVKAASKAEPTVNLSKNADKVTEGSETSQDMITDLHQAGQRGDDVFSYLVGLIYKNRIYPYESIRLKQQGQVMVSFYIDENGEVSDVKVLKSCGHKQLDVAAIKTLKALKIDKKNPQIEKLFSRQYSFIFDFEITKPS